MFTSLDEFAVGSPSMKASFGSSKKLLIQVTVTSSSFKNCGSINGTITSYNYKSIYQVYGLNDSASASEWSLKYKQDTIGKKLDLANSKSVELDLVVDLHYCLQGNDDNVNSVYVYYSEIKLTSNGVTKSYVVDNPDSVIAADISGNPYSGFTLVPSS